MRRLLLISLLCMSPVLASAQTIAPTAPQKPTKPMIDAAERHFDDGVRFTEEGNYEAARICFESGYKLSGEPDFLHNLSWTAERQGQLADAIGYAERYIAAKPDADNAERTRRRIDSLRSRQVKKAAAAHVATIPVCRQQPPAPSFPASERTQHPDKPDETRRLWQGALCGDRHPGKRRSAHLGRCRSSLAGAWATGRQAQAQGLTYEEWASLGDQGRALTRAGLAWRSLAVRWSSRVECGRSSDASPRPSSPRSRTILGKTYLRYSTVRVHLM